MGCCGIVQDDDLLSDAIHFEDDLIEKYAVLHPPRPAVDLGIDRRDDVADSLSIPCPAKEDNGRVGVLRGKLELAECAKQAEPVLVEAAWAHAVALDNVEAMLLKQLGHASRIGHRVGQLRQAPALIVLANYERDAPGSRLCEADENAYQSEKDPDQSGQERTPIFMRLSQAMSGPTIEQSTIWWNSISDPAPRGRAGAQAADYCGAPP